MGFAILGFVIESVTNQTYEQYLEQAVLKPLNLTRTGLKPPTDDNVLESIWWGSDLGIENPYVPLSFCIKWILTTHRSGGMYASTADLLAFGSGILNSRLLTPAQTRRWLKPLTHTSSLGISVGAPWEIARAVNVTLDNRTIDIYTKSGNIGAYVGVLVLIPDYDLVLSLVTCGSQTGFDVVYAGLSKVIKALLPAVEQAGKDEANSTFAGRYQVKGSNTTITISVDDDGPGLKVSDWFFDGVSLAEIWPVLSTATGLPPANPLPPPGFGIRLYPTNLQAGHDQAWRAVFDSATAADPAGADALLFFPQGSCLSWISIDGTLYGLNAFDDFVFTFDETTGKAVSITSRALRETLVRI